MSDNRNQTKRYCYVIMHGSVAMAAYTRSATARSALIKMRDEYLGLAGKGLEFDEYMKFAVEDYQTWDVRKLQMLS